MGSRRGQLDIPGRMQGLPVDPRGYVVPAEAPWRDGKPIISAYDKARTLAIALNSACSQCGNQFDPKDRYWQILAQRDAARARIDNSYVGLSAPGHEVCMMYAALACPFWASSQARLGRGSLLEAGGRRGSLPALIAFEAVTLLVRPGTDPLAAGRPNFKFLYAEVSADRRFRVPRDDLGIRYDELVEEDPPGEWRRSYADGSIAAQDSLEKQLSAHLPAFLKDYHERMIINQECFVRIDAYRPE